VAIIRSSSSSESLVTSVTATWWLCGVSRHPPRVFSQKMAAVTDWAPSRLAEEALGDFGGGLDLAGVEFVAIVLAERFGVDPKNPGDGVFRHTIACHRLDLTPLAGGRLMTRARHQLTSR
jgi:hypothetical protein